MVAMLGACKSKERGAKEEFARAHSCPEGRVTVKARPDLNWQTVVVGDLKPPAEVAADPDRLAKWQADRANAGGDLEVFEAEGCEHHDYLGCTHPKRPGRNGGTTTVLSEVTCMRRGVGEPSAADVSAQATAKANEALQKAEEARQKAAEKQAERAEKEAERAAKKAAKGK
ncbi:MAG: hypothetical protein KIT84_01620 [Labilithrix sp.]|nr:hypothetical protein [Labilithrix sp.]MCW5809685.1 hypothetical protein [Labilithrix sp.]